MTTPLPSFRKPPVVETVIGVQFSPLKELKNAHLALFWSEARDDYPSTQDTPLLPRTYEEFGSPFERTRQPHLRLSQSTASRLWMVSEDEHRLVQLQNGRLLSNWRKLHDGQYPRWSVVIAEFRSQLERFFRFTEREGLGQVSPDQWEVTYINHLFRGVDWETPRNWPGLLPGLIGSTNLPSVGALETGNAKFSFTLPDERGRLHIDVKHAWAETDSENRELLVLELTARGRVSKDSPELDLFGGLDLGHCAILRGFDSIIGPEARERWERSDGDN